MAEQVRICPACGHDNPPDTQFCGRCGAASAPPETVQRVSVRDTRQAASAETTPSAATDLETAEELEYAGFGLRLQAFVLDGLVVAALSIFIGLIATVVWYSIDSYLFREVPEFFAYLALGVGFFALWAIGIPYCWLFTTVRGQTPGKMALRIRVVNSQWGQLELGRTALREVATKPVLLLLGGGPLLLVGGISIVSGPDPTHILVELFSGFPGPWWLIFLTVPVGFLGFLWMIWDSEKQGWHDKIAGTHVVGRPGGDPR